MKKTITQIDSDTGEILGEFVAVVQRKRRNAFGRGWMAMSHEADEWLAKNLTKLDDHRVLRMLTARLDWDNQIVVNQADIAEALNMNRANVSKSIKRLIDIGVILKGEKIGVHQAYKLNPSFGWKGSAQAHRKESHGLTIIDGGRQ